MITRRDILVPLLIEQVSPPLWVTPSRQDSGELQRASGKGTIPGDWHLGDLPKHLFLSFWGRKSFVAFSAPLLSVFHIMPWTFSVLSCLALALSPHCIPFPLHLPGWWCWVPGVVTVRSGVVIDREAFSPPVLELLLLAEDIGLLNGTADLFVTILDDNDNWPTFSSAALTIHLLENCPPGKLGTGLRPRLPGRSWLVVCGGLEPHRLEAEFTLSGEKDRQQSE